MMVLASASKASHPIFSNRCWLIFYTEEETRQGEREEQQQQKKEKQSAPSRKSQSSSANEILRTSKQPKDRSQTTGYIITAFVSSYIYILYREIEGERERDQRGKPQKI